MQRRNVWLVIALSIGMAAPLAAQITPGTVPGTFVGPSSSQTPYTVPVPPGWSTLAIATVGDPAGNGYRMVGLPDGLGALPGRFEDGRYVDKNKYMTVFMNHELGATAGIIRGHGARGSFVSQWTIDLETLAAAHGEDLVRNVYLWNTASQMYLPAIGSAAAMGRLCSADLPAFSAFYNRRTRRGFDGRIYMNGEEVGTQGRGFAHIVTGDGKGDSYELPYLGRMSWENSVAHPDAGDRTIVVALDDSTPGEVYVYVGTKRRSGSPIERAGLHGGKLYGVKVTDGGTNYANGAVPLENAGAITSGHFTLVEVTDPAYVGNGTVLQTFSTNNGITKFARPEDGQWDTRDPRTFYFVVTGADVDGSGGPAPFQSARLYKLRFDFNQAGVPTGGDIKLILDRTAMSPAPPASTAMFDNMTVGEDGHVYIQEDPGGNAYLARTWRVNPKTKTATEILVSDAARFAPPTPAPFDTDDESSGIIEVTDIVRHAGWADSRRRYFLSDIQAHYSVADPELVEGGQLYLIASPRVRGEDDDDDDEDDD
jgi:hypothetical protein